ncbi:MAG TPA: RloB family protein [Verrucomicrobiales bacterium]|nr:RloB family protein [Verrucomicrobiales bacterium]
MKRQRRDYRREVRRSLPAAEQGSGKLYLIVVEGEKTEHDYFTGLRAKLELKSADVVVLQVGKTDPNGMVAEAIRLRDKREDEAKKSLVRARYDEVWVVFDTEAKDHPRAKQLPAAFNRARAQGVLIAPSNPSFEFWLLLHHEATTKYLLDAAAAIKALKKHLPKYQKRALPLEDLLERLKTACKNAAACRKHHEDCQGDGNPSTDVHLLVRSLNDSTAPVFRLL